jgi:hypothetical protein
MVSFLLPGMIPFGSGQMAIEVGRRQFGLALGGLIWPFLAYAQQQRMQVVGYLSSLNAAAAGPMVDGFLRGVSKAASPKDEM